MIKKDEILEILSELEDEVQAMREEGDTDLRTVLTYVRNAYYKVKEM